MQPWAHPLGASEMFDCCHQRLHHRPICSGTGLLIEGEQVWAQIFLRVAEISFSKKSLSAQAVFASGICMNCFVSFHRLRSCFLQVPASTVYCAFLASRSLIVNPSRRLLSLCLLPLLNPKPQTVTTPFPTTKTRKYPLTTSILKPYTILGSC